VSVQDEEPLPLAPLPGRNPLPEGEGDAVGPGRPPAATRFRSGRSGNPRGRPKRAKHLGALVAAALRERTAVEEDGRVRRLTKLEATVRQIVDGAAAGDARSIKLLFALIKADERALAEPDAPRASEADAIVIAELRRRLSATERPRAKRPGGEGAGAESPAAS
jgi:hypothetical protein